MIRFTTVLLSLVLLVACSEKREYTSVSVEDFSELIEDSNVQLLDVRTAQEYADGHIGDAIFIDLADSLFTMKVNDLLDKGQKVAVYCRTGRRSKKAAEELIKQGYEVVELNLGITGWQAEGLPLTE